MAWKTCEAWRARDATLSGDYEDHIRGIYRSEHNSPIDDPCCIAQIGCDGILGNGNGDRATHSDTTLTGGRGHPCGEGYDPTGSLGLDIESVGLQGDRVVYGRIDGSVDKIQSKRTGDPGGTASATAQ